MQDDRIDPWVAIAGFATLAVFLVIVSLGLVSISSGDAPDRTLGEASASTIKLVFSRVR
jgi:hypothetical protein